MMPIFSDDDPQLAALRAEQQARHGAAIAYVKRQVGAGTEYANEVARVVLSDAGAYFQLSELPEEFVGALGPDITHRMIAEADALATMARLGALLQGVAAGHIAARELSLYVLYPGGSLRARRAMFVFDHRQDNPAPFTHGVLRPDSVPRVFKLRLHLSPDQTPAGLPSEGTVLFLAPSHTDGGQCLLATIPHTADARNLGIYPKRPNNLRAN